MWSGSFITGNSLIMDGMEIHFTMRFKYRYTGGLGFSILAHIRKPTVCHGRAELSFSIKLSYSGQQISQIIYLHA